jgi:hypothetical protein
MIGSESQAAVIFPLALQDLDFQPEKYIALTENGE